MLRFRFQRKVVSGAEEMAQQLRALAALPEVLISVPSNHMVMGSDALFCHMAVHTCTCIHKIYKQK